MKPFFLIFSMIVTLAAFSAEKIGEVVALEGRLSAIDPSSTERTLAKHSDILLGDTLVTEELSKGEIRFTDGTQLILIPGSRYSVDSYGVKANRFLSRLIQGGARILTGLIAKKNPENFQMTTSNATIGVRGTHFEANLVGGDLYVGSSSGEVVVNNNGGSLSIGGKMPSHFAKVSSMESAPVPLPTRPDALSLSLFAPPSGASMAAAASVSGTVASQSFAWGPGLGALVMLGGAVSSVVAATTQGTSSTTTATVTHAHAAPQQR